MSGDRYPYRDQALNRTQPFCRWLRACRPGSRTT